MLNHQDLVQEINGLKRFALKLTRNHSDADDLLQATLLKSLEHAHAFQPGTHLFGWTSRILYNTFVSQYRHRVRFESRYDPQDSIDQQLVEPDQEASMELALVCRAMESLTPDHQQMLQLTCIEGLPYAEVAEQLEIPVGTVRSRLARARLALRDVLRVSTSPLRSDNGDTALVA